MNDPWLNAVAWQVLQRARSVHVLSLAPDGTIQACNEAAGDNLGLAREDLVGQPVFRFLTSPDARRLQSELLTCGRRQDPILLNFSDVRHRPYTLDCWLDVHPGGGTLVGEPPLQDDRRRQQELVSVTQDLALLSRDRARLMADERRARLDAEAATREKDRAIATIAHELRQPLNPLRFALDIVRSDGPPAARERALRAMERQVTYLTRLVEDLLDAARIRADKLTLDRTRFDLSGLLRDVAEGFHQKAAAAGLTFELQLPASPVRVFADPGRVTQVFSNLLDNAAKYTDPGGTVTLTLSADGPLACATVRDTGRGIAPETMPRLFQLFAQQGEGEQGGLGIGLAVAHGIVTMHGGTIQVRSGGAGLGSEFDVRLPVEDGAGPPAGAHRRRDTAP